MKTRLLPMVTVIAALVAGIVLPVYASEKSESATSIATESAANKTADSMSKDLIQLSTAGSAAKVVQADIQGKEQAAKEAAEKAAKEAAEKAAAEKAAQEAAAKAAAEQAAKEAAEEEAAQQAAAEEAAQAETAQPSGRTLVMESTAYSSDPADLLGGGTVTATGQNLLENPMAVAVDPNVIPLGTKLYVEGYGEAYAVDTGSAIKGNIIDVHFPTNDQCIVWGRRQVTVTIIG